jgi:hypothetical protein
MENLGVPGFAETRLMNAPAVTLAYKFVAIALMLSEANFFCQQTGLSKGRVLTHADLRDGSHVGVPKSEGLTGSILTDNYFFGFEWGQLANFYKRGFMPQSDDTAIRKRNTELSKIPSQIDAQGAVGLATNWLGKLGINIEALENKYRRNVVQWKFYPHGPDSEPEMLPVYQIEWRGFIIRSQPKRYESAVVTVTVFGATSELVEYHVLDKELFTRSPLKVSNLTDVLAISDEEFRLLSPLQKSNLVVQAAKRE